MPDQTRSGIHERQKLNLRVARPAINVLLHGCVNQNHHREDRKTDQPANKKYFKRKVVSIRMVLTSSSPCMRSLQSPESRRAYTEGNSSASRQTTEPFGRFVAPLFLDGDDPIFGMPPVPDTCVPNINFTVK